MKDRIITVDTVYYIPGRYGDAQKTGKHYFDKLSHLKEIVSNASEIDWNGVNFVIINEDENKIFQTSGYTYERGLFNDLY